jgi:hypothetical protein
MNKQANLLKIAAVAIAIPRYAGAFALSAGYVAEGDLHRYLGIAEVIAGVSMAVLEGFALAFILNKWRLLKTSSLPWWSLLMVISLLALSLPMVAVPYLYFAQGLSIISSIFPNIWVQNGWNFVVAGVPMLVVVGVGLADVDELERERRQLDYELEVRTKRAEVELAVSQFDLEAERDKISNELELNKLKADHKVSMRNMSAKADRNVSKSFICEYCNEAFAKHQQLNGHLAHCKVKQNGNNSEEPIEVR